MLEHGEEELLEVWRALDAECRESLLLLMHRISAADTPAPTLHTPQTEYRSEER